GNDGQWSKASAAWMRRPSLQGCIYGDFTERPLFPTEKHGIVRLWHEKASLLMAGARSGKVCLIAKDSRIHADRPRHPWRGRFALQAYHSFPVGLDDC
ncbi:hypothetical protein NGC37_21310, partial [Pantoea anthophila]|uniref:hypothetical protein n=1 Tax=Pantoea anthophila TaxID=470931 RepID=UPI002DB75C49